ncbi:MAG: SDR family NAD(P)-dependent oxidoreductase [Saprospiraceae bacterium]|nr:SDR family NAD(P)-dependent oxidoreductase [Saprospiraceae bacterium]
MKDLENKVALVTGASRGIGKGIAIALTKSGATVYITGRTEQNEHKTTKLSGSIYQTRDEITSLGGKCIAIRCDHTIDEEVVDVFDQIFKRHNKLDILVNSVWGGYEYFNDGTKFWLEKGFWESPISRWDKMFSSGVRAAYFASAQAAKIMVKQQSGIIFNLSFWAAERSDKGVAYCTSKAATNKMTEAMAYELHPFNIPVICLYPGIVRTEAVMQNKEHFDLSNSESPEFIGRVIAKMASDPKAIEKTGKILIAAKEAMKYGISDVNGKQPRPLSVDEI